MTRDGFMSNEGLNERLVRSVPCCSWARLHGKRVFGFEQLLKLKVGINNICTLSANFSSVRGGGFVWRRESQKRPYACD